MQNSNNTLVELLALRAQYGFITSPACFINLRRSAGRNLTYIFRNELERPIGYIAWANINKESFVRLQKTGIMPTFPYEWDEGRLTLVVDMAFGKGHTKHLRATLSTFLSRKRVVIFLKRKCLSVYSKKEGQFKLVSKKRFEA